MNKDRRKIRDVFSRIADRNDMRNVHLKDYLITICPQITETKFDDETRPKESVARQVCRWTSLINALRRKMSVNA